MTFTKIKRILEENGIKSSDRLDLDVVSGIMGSYYYSEIAENDEVFEAICILAHRVYLKTNGHSTLHVCECIMSMIFDGSRKEEYHINLTDVLNNNVDIGVIKDCLAYYYYN